MFEKSGYTSYLMRLESSTGGFYLFVPETSYFALPAYATKILDKLNSMISNCIGSVPFDQFKFVGNCLPTPPLTQR